MKKWFIIFVIIMSTLVLSACQEEEVIKCFPDIEQTVTEPKDSNFEVQYIRTDGYHNNAYYPVVKIIRSVDELKDYYEENKDIYSLERRTGTIYADSTIGFLDACDKYDEKYFESQILLMILLEEGSGSIRHKVERVNCDEGNMTIEITTVCPELCTDDMALWHILIEPEDEVDIEREDNVAVFINGRNATEKLTKVDYEKGWGKVSLMLKEGWEYDIVDRDDADEFSIDIYPQGQPENKLSICYYDFFAVCGTELTSERIKLGRYDAIMATHVTDELWKFISVREFLGVYVIQNEGAEKWWDEYGNEAMQILESLTLSNGYISEEKAIQIAKDKADSADEKPQASFDREKAVWRVTLSGKNTSGDDTFIIDIYGNIVEIIE